MMDHSRNLTQKGLTGLQSVEQTSILQALSGFSKQQPDAYRGFTQMNADQTGPEISHRGNPPVYNRCTFRSQNRNSALDTLRAEKEESMTKHLLLILALSMSVFDAPHIRLKNYYPKEDATLRLANGKECTAPVGGWGCYIEDLSNGTYHGSITVAGNTTAVTIVVTWGLAICTVDTDATIVRKDQCYADK